MPLNRNQVPTLPPEETPGEGGVGLSGAFFCGAPFNLDLGGNWKTDSIQDAAGGACFVPNGAPLLWPEPTEGNAWRALLRGFKNQKFKAKLLDDCINFLQPFAAVNEPLKKEVLRKMAVEHLRQKVPVRIFNEAYRQVFKRDRGRPANRR
jgi:hypothetical protein